MQEYKDAIDVLSLVLVRGQPLEFKKHHSSLCKQLCYGVLRDYNQLVYFRDSLLTKKTKHQDLNILLLCGIYSICELNRPDYASVNAVVETAVAIKKPWAKGLLNGVLRNFQRRRETLTTSMDKDTNLNHPPWLINELRLAWPEQADSIMAANKHPAPMTLRVNLSKTDLTTYQSMLKDNGLSTKAIPTVPGALQLLNAVSVESLPGFSGGLVSIQDQASQLVAPLLDTKPGQKVLDACAAPGGKTCHLLELQPDLNLLAMDWDRHRIDKIQENLDRLGTTCQVTRTDFLTYTGEKFDRILLDVPCSATGIIRRHPDIKLLRDRDDVDKLSITQSRLLATAWNFLETGGELLYSTCSILPQENELVVSDFANKREDLVVLPVDIAEGIALTIGRQLFPTIDGHDGFYIARLRKVA
jgi:16S rRNA (cytosine967-C5)-methyltransferase|tara:strand:- start:1575 stop:2819 length:1245 start_codon:yes stop_codon:yes gene_type:complete